MKPFKWKDFDIAHRHVFNYVYFSAWKGSHIVAEKEIRIHRLDVNWKKPLSKEQLLWLCEKDEGEK